MATGIGKLREPSGGWFSFLVLLLGTVAMGLAAYGIQLRQLHGNEVAAGLLCWFASAVLARVVLRNFRTIADVLCCWASVAAALWMGYATFSVGVGSLNTFTVGLLSWSIGCVVAAYGNHPLRMIEDLPTRSSVATLLWGVPSVAMLLFMMFELRSMPLVGTTDINLALFSMALMSLAAHVRYHVEYARRLADANIVIPDLLSLLASVGACVFLGAAAFSIGIAQLPRIEIGLMALGLASMLERSERFSELPPLSSLPDGTVVSSIDTPTRESWASTYHREGGALRSYADEVSWYALGGARTPTIPYWRFLIESEPKGPVMSATFPDRTVLRGSRRTTYYILGGTKYVVPTLRALHSLGCRVRDVVRISDSALSAIPNGAPLPG